MALDKATKERLSAMGINVDKLAEAIKSHGEVAIEVPNGQFLTEEQLNERIANERKEAATDGEKTGEKNALNIAQKEFKKHGIELKGERWGDVAATLKTELSANGDEKTKSMQQQIDALISDKTSMSAEMETLKQSYAQERLQSKVLNAMPHTLPGLTKEETYTVLERRGYTFTEKDGQILPMKNGQPFTDPTTRSVLPLDAGIKEIFKEQNIAPPTEPPAGGRGIKQPGIPTGGVAMTMTDVRNEFKSLNPDVNPVGPEFQAFYQSKLKENPNIDPLS